MELRFGGMVFRHHMHPCKVPVFWGIDDGELHRSSLGEIAHRYWLEIPNHFPLVSLDEFVIMPDHVHGIIVITAAEPVETQHAASLQDNGKNQYSNLAASLRINQQNQFSNQKGQKSLPKPGSISTIVRSYKSAVSHWAGENRYTEFGWQARFYDRIIRNEAGLANLRLYIAENPHRILQDDDYPPNIEI